MMAILYIFGMVIYILIPIVMGLVIFFVTRKLQLNNSISLTSLLLPLIIFILVPYIDIKYNNIYFENICADLNVGLHIFETANNVEGYEIKENNIGRRNALIEIYNKDKDIIPYSYIEEEIGGGKFKLKKINTNNSIFELINNSRRSNYRLLIEKKEHKIPYSYRNIKEKSEKIIRHSDNKIMAYETSLKLDNPFPIFHYALSMLPTFQSHEYCGSFSKLKIEKVLITGTGSDPHNSLNYQKKHIENGLF